MRAHHALTEETLAELYVGSRGGYLPTTSGALEADIERYLRAGRMIHRLPDVPEIARAVRRIAAEDQEPDPVQQPMPTPEELAWEQHVRQGTTATDELAMRQMDELALTQRVQQMSVAEFGAERERFGLHKNTVDFLGGH